MLSGLCFAKPFSMVNNSTKQQSNVLDPFPSPAPFRRRKIPFLAWKIVKLYHIRLRMWYGTLIFTRLSSYCEKIHCYTGWQPHLLLFRPNNYFNVFKNGSVSGGSVFTLWPLKETALESVSVRKKNSAWFRMMIFQIFQDQKSLLLLWWFPKLPPLRSKSSLPMLI